MKGINRKSVFNHTVKMATLGLTAGSIGLELATTPILLQYKAYQLIVGVLIIASTFIVGRMMVLKYQQERHYDNQRNYSLRNQIVVRHADLKRMSRQSLPSDTARGRIATADPRLQKPVTMINVDPARKRIIRRQLNIDHDLAELEAANTDFARQTASYIGDWGHLVETSDSILGVTRAATKYAVGGGR